MKRIRVLIVDDAVVVRRMVSDVLAADPGIEVVGTAANGRIGLQKIPQGTPTSSRSTSRCRSSMACRR